MLNCGLVGIGRWGKNLYRELGVRLTGVCELDESKWPSDRQVPFTTDIKDFLSWSNLDAVCIATPIHTHYELARQALLAGKHVWVEKPLCTSSEQAKSLVRLAREKRRRLFVGHIMNYHVGVQLILQWLYDHPHETVQAFYSERGKFMPDSKDHNTGPVLWDLGPHDVSIMCRLLPHRICDGTLIEATSQDLTVGLQLEGNRVAKFTWSRRFLHKRASYMIETPQFLVYFDDTKSDSSEQVKVFNKFTCQHEYLAPAEYVSPLEKEIQAFVECCIGPRDAYTNGEEGLRVVEILEMLEHGGIQEVENVLV